MKKGIIGKKLGMTQIFLEDGSVVPVTVIEAGPCTVAQKKTVENDGYDAVQLAYDTKGVPTCIVLNTVKGLGATFAEGTGAHSSQPSKEQWDEAIAAAEKKLAEIKAQ